MKLPNFIGKRLKPELDQNNKTTDLVANIESLAKILKTNKLVYIRWENKDLGKIEMASAPEDPVTIKSDVSETDERFKFLSSG